MISWVGTDHVMSHGACIDEIFTDFFPTSAPADWFISDVPWSIPTRSYQHRSTFWSDNGHTTMESSKLSPRALSHFASQIVCCLPSIFYAAPLLTFLISKHVTSSIPPRHFPHSAQLIWFCFSEKSTTKPLLEILVYVTCVWWSQNDVEKRHLLSYSRMTFQEQIRFDNGFPSLDLIAKSHV